MSGTTSVNVNAVRLALEAENATEHALVITTDQGVLRVVGTVAQLRAAAQSGLMLGIPALPRETPASASASAPAGSTEARFASIEASLARLTEIADRASRRGLI